MSTATAALERPATATPLGEEFTSEAWRLFPHTYAARMSAGRWHLYRHLSYVGQAIAAAVHGAGKRLIVELPPRHGKSELISHWTPVWYLDLFPERRVILTTYEADFAARWGRLVRNEIQNRADLNVGIVDDSHAADRWDTTVGGGMATAGVGGPIMGKGGNLLIIDDPIKNWAQAQSAVYRTMVQEWFRSTFYTRAEPDAAIIVLMQRWHEQDLAGWLQTEHSDDWRVVRLPATAEAGDQLGRPVGAALCPERYDETALAAIRKSLGPHMYASLYQQRPTAQEGNVFKRHWWRYWTTLPDSFDELVQSWDLSFDDTEGSAYTVGQVWGRRGADKYLVDQVRDQMDVVAQIRAIEALSEKWPGARAKLIEKKANGAAVIKMLRSKIAGLIPVEPRGSKETRALAVQPEVESGNVYVPAPSVARWAREFVEECSAFPKSTYKDQVDAMTQALLRFSLRQKTGSLNIGSFTKESGLAL